ncbi:helix-turn-helix transcriptional regulator [Rhizobium daejeonense]|uniref:Helix-turn-helix transcriptional regulator n=1 Tax=Rhizobium daejeonense TaxID=240521 RepID=A0A6M1RUE4_9HYPH|nr:helix-turn-helix transcriptional regulator [Rhizobium daejeonense]NGO62453.1 helix-turn-helix transcriptional regulator [Rhizobium daejeonense]
MVTKSQFGVRLRQLRKEKKLTQEELAVRIGRSVDALSNLERGKSLPNFITIEQLAQALDVPLGDLFDFDETAISPRRAQLFEELQAVARRLPDNDLELAVEQVRAIGRHSR